MLGDTPIFGLRTCAIDDKGRVGLPKFIKSVEPGERLLVLKDNNIYLKIYNTEVWQQKLQILKDKQIMAHDQKDIDSFQRKIEIILASIIDTIGVDKQGRILISRELRERYMARKQVFIQGNLDHFRIYESEDSYNEYMKMITK